MGATRTDVVLAQPHGFGTCLVVGFAFGVRQTNLAAVRVPPKGFIDDFIPK